MDKEELTEDEIRKEIYELRTALSETIVGILNRSPSKLKFKVKEGIMHTLKKTMKGMR